MSPAPRTRFRCEPPGSLVVSAGAVVLREHGDEGPRWVLAQGERVVALLDEGLTPAEISKLGDLREQARIHALLSGLAALGRLDLDFAWRGRELATLRRVTPALVLTIASPPAEAVVLSRLSHLRSEQHGEERTAILEHALSPCRVVLHAPELGALLVTLAAPTEPRRLSSAAPWASAFVGLLLAAGFVVAAGSEESDPALLPWEFHDALMHGRQLRTRPEERGGTYRLRARLPSPPMLRAPSGGATVALAKPPLENTGPGIFTVLERRRSLRAYGADDPEVDRLAALLFHAARLVSVREGPEGPLAQRPFPSPGARHSLEVYVGVGRCRGLASGFYRYDLAAHGLEHIEGAKIERLLALATLASEPPPLLLLLTARFARASWKYETNAHALLLQEVGVLLQTMHMVACALDLASCMVDRNVGPWFAQTTGESVLVESPVGALAVGTLPRSERATP